MPLEACVVVFAKPPRPGAVKTRLVHSRLSATDAAELYEAFLGDLVERLDSGSFDLRIAWAMEDGEPLPAGSREAVRQQGDDLGARLFNALRDAGGGHELVAAVGSDHPDLPLERVEAAFDALRGGREVVLGPSRDGGYYLIGLRASAVDQALFLGIEWSTGGVLDATLARARGLGLDIGLLPVEEDVDRPADLDALVARLEGGRRAPRTATLLRSWGWMAAPE
ncbi:MAG: TIGR04282 family arsenosugar biosynthesis glycosyltransferase [Thermoanaerobaculia bacterium]